VAIVSTATTTTTPNPMKFGGSVASATRQSTRRSVRPDMEAAKLMGIERSTINARRAPLCKEGVVVPKGVRKSAAGVNNVVWVVRR
jgi:hypothetical protein